MIRDQEELLNSVYDKQIRDYFKEALDCYNTKAYKACVILSVIAGMDDLFKKIDMLSTEFNESQRSQFDRIRIQRNNSKPFERDLINFCNEDGFGILSRYEIKELEYCFDLRNSFAHPSEEECTAEKARYVFSVMIDLVSSKKMLGGYIYIESLINQIGRQFYYPVLDASSVIDVTSNALKFVDNKKYVILLKKILDKLRDRETTNYEYFISTLIDNIDDIEELNQTIEPALTEGFIRYSSFKIIYRLHPDVFQKFDSINSQKILRILLKQSAPKQLLCDIFQEFVKVHKNLSEQIIQDICENLIKEDNDSYGKFYELDKEMKRFLRILYEHLSKESAIQKIENIVDIFKDKKIKSINLIISLLFDLKENVLVKKLLDILKEKIISQTYGKSNPAIEEFCELMPKDFDCMESIDILDFFFFIIEASGRGSTSAHPIVDNFTENAFFQYVEKSIIDMNDDYFSESFYKKHDRFIIYNWRKIAEKDKDSNIANKYNEYWKKRMQYQTDEFQFL